MKWYLAFLVLALVVEGVGCSSTETVKEPDRVVVEYNRQMWSQVAVIASGLGSSVPDAAVALAQLAVDGTAAANHMVQIWGPPKVAPPPYNPANLKTAIDQSSKAHASVWLHPWAIVGYTAMGILTALKIAGSFFPGVGTFISSAAGQLVETIGGSLVNLKHKADSEPDDSVHLEDIQGEIDTAAKNPAVASLLTRLHVDKLLGSSITATAIASPAPKPTAAPA